MSIRSGKRTQVVTVRTVTLVDRSVTGDPIFELRTSAGRFRTAASCPAGAALTERTADDPAVRLRLEFNGHGTVERIEALSA